MFSKFRVFYFLFYLRIVHEIFLRDFVLVIALDESKFHSVWMLLNLELPFIQLFSCLHILILSVCTLFLQSEYGILRVFLCIPIYRFLPPCLCLYISWVFFTHLKFLILVPLPRHVSNPIIEELVKVKSTFSQKVHTAS